ncbi:calcium-dependent phosphotriesterase [Testicularia cyperi]|uniref:Calcium-dependent phosphotriesterase n=1 Tax=Testicularia cyperi TaxID=1882483 RepID=A0A317XU16_9BASI|nr:calcium-dependent phosphotriesterase [Testicularia cyperi]
MMAGYARATTWLLAATAMGAATSAAQSRLPSANTSVIYLDSKSLASLPLPFPSRSFGEQPFVTANGSVLNTSVSTSSLAGGFNATSVNQFHVYDAELAAPILGSDPSVHLMVYEQGYAFAHEAPVYFPDTQDIYFCSDAGGARGRSGADQNNVVFKLNLDNIEAKLRNNTEPTFAQDVTEVEINSDGVQMTNGGTNYNRSLLLINSGRTEAYPPSIALVDRDQPANVRVLLNNAAGRQFNALNDVVVHPKTGAIFFTDAWYGQTQGFRPQVDLPLAVWRFDPNSGTLTALTDPSVVSVPNGLAFSPEGDTLYVSDTSPIYNGVTSPNATHPASIYAFGVNTDIDSGFQWLGPRRVFAWPETGIADGIKVDTQGNVYTGTGDGVSVFSKHGKPILKVFMPQTGGVNLVFAQHGRLVVTAQERIFLVQLGPSVTGPPIWDYPYN